MLWLCCTLSPSTPFSLEGRGAQSCVCCPRLTQGVWISVDGDRWCWGRPTLPTLTAGTFLISLLTSSSCWLVRRSYCQLFQPPQQRKCDCYGKPGKQSRGITISPFGCLFVERCHPSLPTLPGLYTCQLQMLPSFFGRLAVTSQSHHCLVHQASYHPDGE